MTTAEHTEVGVFLDQIREAIEKLIVQYGIEEQDNRDLWFAVGHLQRAALLVRCGGERGRQQRNEASS